MTILNAKLSTPSRVIAIISLSLSSMALGFNVGQLFIIHGHNYSEGVGIFPGLVFILGLPAMVIGLRAKKKEE